MTNQVKSGTINKKIAYHSNEKNLRRVWRYKIFNTFFMTMQMAVVEVVTGERLFNLAMHFASETVKFFIGRDLK